jgi:molybdopterin synthase catalytic subunit
LSAGLVDEPIDVAAVERRVAAWRCGAVLLFLGTVRDRHQGRPVRLLTYTAYRPMALKTLKRITDELEAATQSLRVEIVHRLGDVPVGEASVLIAVASPHRQAAYEASREALERLKREVPIWKREHYDDGEVAWREEEPLGFVSRPF